MSSNDYLSFRLPESFLARYADRDPKWGLRDAGGTSLSEIVFLRTYSRRKPDGTKESWFDVCRRITEGTFSIQKDYIKTNRLEWNDRKAQATAQDFFDRLFARKFTPPGRGIQNAGSEMVNGAGFSTALQNCGAMTTASMTKYDPASCYAWLMQASMLGVGIGFDTKGAEKGFVVYEPKGEAWTFTIPDTREGWAESLQLLLESYLIAGKQPVEFDYSLIRPEGALIKSFGSPAPGPEPLRKLHRYIRAIWVGRDNTPFTSTDIVDICNLTGKCVVSGNIRRSALLAYGDITDNDFVNLKNWKLFPRRTGGEDLEAWAWMSNNSIRAKVSDDLSGIAEGIALNGEPGVIWEDVVKTRGRLIDPPDTKDARFVSFNPCAEQPLEHMEFCTLVDVYVDQHETLEDFQRTLKVAYLYAKSVTLLPTHFPESNGVMQRNRRIGTSLSGCANFIDGRQNGLLELRRWFDEGYKTVREYDKIYSEWLCVRESNRVTTVKPGGTTGVLAGTSSGVHWTDGGEFFMRTIRFGKNDPLVKQLELSGHLVEPDAMDPDTSVVVYFPVHSDAKRAARDVSIFEKAALAVEAQRLWSDNGVSCTVTFDVETESQHVATILNMYAGQLKAISFLPLGNDIYPQMPYGSLEPSEYEDWTYKLLPTDFSPVIAAGLDVQQEEGCTTDVCIMKNETAGAPV